MEEIIINTKLSFEDYRKANFFLLYRRRMTRGLLILGLLLVVGTMGMFLFVPGFYATFPILPVALGLAMLLLPPLSLMSSSKKNYHGDARLREKFTYKFDDDNIQVIGETFHTTFAWEKVYRLEVSKNWLLLWQSKQMALLIPMRDVSSSQVHRLQKIAEKHPDVRKKW